ncbi:hypothetical protein WA026_015556 [Henosepilachna vigintioctopunctata]|uniref:Tudor domain-containing protein n=1 Tax=Henosepilachna vigintioctopunctata TaxID=420089 RepID=A0AAW1V7C2_9CUCU
MSTNHSTEDSITDSQEITNSPDFQQRSTTKIKSIFDKWEFKVDSIIPIYMGNIYDPSKFWVRIAPISVFERYLTLFYERNKMSLCVKSSDVCIGLNCVLFKNGVYYRARIVRKDIQNQNKVKVFLLDYGSLNNALLSDIFHLDQSFYEIPAFAVRAMLTNISSLDHGMWTANVVDKFMEYVKNKILIAKIARVHKQQKVIEIHLSDVDSDDGDGMPTINSCLVKDRLAKFISKHPSGSQLQQIMKIGDRECILLKELYYLYPSFETIENGLVPSTVELKEKLQQYVPLDVIYPDLYEHLF